MGVFGLLGHPDTQECHTQNRVIASFLYSAFGLVTASVFKSLVCCLTFAMTLMVSANAMDPMYWCIICVRSMCCVEVFTMCSMLACDLCLARAGMICRRISVLRAVGVSTPDRQAVSCSLLCGNATAVSWWGVVIIAVD